MNRRRSLFKSVAALAVGMPSLARTAETVGTPGPAASLLTPANATVPGRQQRATPYVEVSADEPLVKENVFVRRTQDLSAPPSYAEARQHLPTPFWAGHETAIAGYWRAWELAFQNTHAVDPPSGFIAPFIDAAFNQRLFMWDSVFMLMFARYGERAFAFQKTLDNFYAKQHDNGFICREISEATGDDAFSAGDPNSTGPNLLPWSEWEYFQQFGDRQRLAEVFPPLLAYYRWFRKNRTWPSGAYWATGWACGMDNQPRLSSTAHPEWDHDHLSWVDTTCQAIFSAGILVKMAAVLGRTADTHELPEEIKRLTRYVNQHMWNDKAGFYVDHRRDGRLSDVKSIAGYWAVIAGIATPPRRARMVAHLSNAKTFGRPHPIPTLSADNSEYKGDKGGYWLGSVWPSTNYMVLRGLTAAGEHALAHRLGLQHHDKVTQVYADTNTFWENYSPEKVAPGVPAKSDFVGWGGVGPIAVFLEYVLGLRPDFSRHVLVWDIRLTEAHGVKDYPLGNDTTLQLSASARASASEAPVVQISSNRDVRVELRWPGGSRTVDVAAS